MPVCWQSRNAHRLSCRDRPTLTAKQIGMLAGLAPIADQSGQRDSARVICGGHRAVRRILYLPAFTAVPC